MGERKTGLWNKRPEGHYDGDLRLVKVEAQVDPITLPKNAVHPDGTSAAGEKVDGTYSVYIIAGDVLADPSKTVKMMVKAARLNNPSFGASAQVADTRVAGETINRQNNTYARNYSRSLTVGKYTGKEPEPEWVSEAKELRAEDPDTFDADFRAYLAQKKAEREEAKKKASKK